MNPSEVAPGIICISILAPFLILYSKFLYKELKTANHRKSVLDGAGSEIQTQYSDQIAEIERGYACQSLPKSNNSTPVDELNW